MTAKKSTKKAAKLPAKKPKLSPEVAHIEKERQEQAKKRAEATTEVKSSADKPAVAAPEVPAGAHAEEQLAIQQGNKQFATESSIRSEAGKAIMSVDIPAHKKDVVLAFSQIEGCALAAVQAWDAVKNHDDAPFASCVLNHQMKLVSHAESVYRGGNPMSGDTVLARFEREVARIKSEQDKEKS